MKHFFTYIIIVLLLPIAARSQKVHFTDTANRWISDCTSELAPTTHHYDTVRYLGDTFYNGLLYHKTSYFPQYVLVREDTLTGKVYTRHYLGDTSEQLLYDYTLQLGDTLTTNAYQYGNNYQVVKSIVTEYDSVLLNNNVWHKRWRFFRPNALSYHVIEGIGCLESGMFFPYQPQTVEYWCNLCALQQNNNYLYGSYNGCYHVGIEEPGRTPPFVTVPNPCTINDKMLFSDAACGGHLHIYNMSGQQLADITVSGSYVQPSQYITVPGMYFYRFTCGKYPSVSGKFLFRS